MEGRARFTATALNFIKQVPSEILPEILLEELSKRARIAVTELKQQVKKPETTTPNVITLPEQQPDLTKPKLKAPMQAALALLVQNPDLASLVPEALPESSLLGDAFLRRLTETIQQHPNINTAGLIEYWRGQKEERFVASLACWEHTIPEAGIANEFLGTIRQLNLLIIEEEINRLLAKAALEGLAEEEKQELSGWIVKKKAVTVQNNPAKPA